MARQHIYVWQRVWTQSVQRATREHGKSFTAIDVLAAEIAFSPKISVAPTKVSWPALRAASRPVALVIRIGPCASTWSTGSTELQAVLSTCRSALHEARGNGIEPAELQIDFDAATRALDAYRRLLLAIRSEIKPPRLVITVLPTWMRSSAFPALAAMADEYVLQVHSLDKPVSAQGPFALCDIPQALAAVHMAAEIGRPFRVALPAYGYRVAFGTDGRFLGLEAEGPGRAWPPDAIVRNVIADPPSLASFVAALARMQVPAMTGLAWFRLPTGHDDLAWRWQTLATVMKGRPPRALISVRPRGGESGIVELLLTNSGSDDATPGKFRITWPSAPLIAADGVNGWTIERRSPHELWLAPDGPASVCRPGDALVIGWLRLASTVAIDIAPL